MTEQNSNLGTQETKNTYRTESPQPQEEYIPDPTDVEKNKTMAGLAYLLFFLPLLVCPDSKYAKFHANQALLLWIAVLAGNVILSIIPVIGWVLLPVYGLGMLVVGVMGLINGFQGKAKRLPIIGKFDLIN
jgi:uncharacterized membrane protein